MSLVRLSNKLSYCAIIVLGPILHTRREKYVQYLSVVHASLGAISTSLPWVFMSLTRYHGSPGVEALAT